MFVIVGVKVTVRVAVSAMVLTGEGAAAAVEGNVFIGVSVPVPVDVAVGLDAIKEDAAAPTDETSWATINKIAMRVAAMPREAKDLLA